MKEPAMHTRSVLVSLAAGGVILTQGGAASAAQTTQLRASFTGSAQGHLSAKENCLVRPVKPADFKCQFGTTAVFRNAKLHGVRRGALHFDFSTRCAKVSGRLTDFVFRNNGQFLGSFTEQLVPGGQGDSCVSSRLGDIQTQLLRSNVIGGTGIYSHQKGTVETHSATVRPVNLGDPIVIAGIFVAQLHK